jgi:hypothetical protein
MSKNIKLQGPNKGLSSFSPQFLEKAETCLNRLLTTQESNPEAQEIITSLVQDLDENPVVAEIVFKKIAALPRSFSLWFLPVLNLRTQSKPVKKGIKRALYLLKQKGIEMPSPMEQQSKHGGGILRNIEPVQATGYLSEFDGLKNQMLGLLIPKPTQGRLFVFALIGSEGMESLNALEVSKKEVKDIIADLEGRSGLVLLEADLGHVAFVLKEAHDRHSQLSKDDEGAYQGIINLLEGKKMVGRSPIIHSLLTLESRERPLSSDIPLLAKTPEIFYLLPEPKDLEPYLKEVEEVRAGLLILNEMQQRERLNGIVERAIRELFPQEKCDGLLRYLEEVAYLYVLKKRPDEAEALLYWAETLDQEKESRQGRENPLLLWLMETVLLAKEGEKPPTFEPKEQTTQGGIIIPSWVRTVEDSG